MKQSRHRPDAPARASRQLAERAMSAMFASGATVALVAVALTPLPDAQHPWVSLNAVLGYPSAVVLFLGRGRFPGVVLHVLLAIGSLQVAVGMYLIGGGAASAAAGALLVWVSLYAFYFFPRRQAVVHLLVAGVGLGLGLAVLREPGGLAAWMFTFGTGVVAGAIVGHLTLSLRRIARTDPMTGIANRLAWEEAVEQHLAAARRHGRPVTLALVDLDDLKLLNDDLGHHAGDRALCEVAHALQRRLRHEDLVARIGGDEFGLAFPDTTADAAAAVLDRVRDESPYPFSCGVAQWLPGETLAATVARADDALYEAKSAGRGRSRTAAPGPAQAPKTVASSSGATTSSWS